MIESWLARGIIGPLADAYQSFVIAKSLTGKDDKREIFDLFPQMKTLAGIDDDKKVAVPGKDAKEKLAYLFDVLAERGRQGNYNGKINPNK